MDIKAELMQSLKQKIKVINSMLPAAPKTIWPHFFSLVVTKARLKRLGGDKVPSSYHELLKVLKPYHQDLGKIYEQECDWEQAQAVVQYAQELSKQLVLFGGESLSPEQETIKSRLEQQGEALFVKRESLELAYQELQDWVPEFDKPSGLEAIARVWCNVYLAPVTRSRLADYIVRYGVDMDEMPWFQRPGIEEMPVVLPCEMEECEVEAMLEALEGQPVATPELKIIPYQQAEYCLAAATSDLEQHLYESNAQRQCWQDPLVDDLADDGSLKVCMIIFQGKVCLEVSSQHAGLQVQVNRKSFPISPTQKYAMLTLGNVADFKRPLHLQVWVGAKLCYEKRWYIVNTSSTA